jgi:hypothetical protein
MHHGCQALKNAPGFPKTRFSGIKFDAGIHSLETLKRFQAK